MRLFLFIAATAVSLSSFANYSDKVESQGSVGPKHKTEKDGLTVDAADATVSWVEEKVENFEVSDIEKGLKWVVKDVPNKAAKKISDANFYIESRRPNGGDDSMRLVLEARTLPLLDTEDLGGLVSVEFVLRSDEGRFPFAGLDYLKAVMKTVAVSEGIGMEWGSLVYNKHEQLLAGYESTTSVEYFSATWRDSNVLSNSGETIDIGDIKLAVVGSARISAAADINDVTDIQWNANGCGGVQFDYKGWTHTPEICADIEGLYNYNSQMIRWSAQRDKYQLSGEWRNDHVDDSNFEDREGILFRFNYLLK